jgi:crinkler effector protein
MANQLMLWCILFQVPENDPNRIFNIKIDSDEVIARLKNMIKLKNAPELNYLDAPDLELWKCSIPFNSLKATLNSLRFDGSDDHLNRLIPTSTVGRSFLEQPPSETLHVIVKVPPGACISFATYLSLLTLYIL